MITKGSRIVARWLKAEVGACLSGAQMKLGAKSVEISGVVRHVRGDHPTNPTRIGIFVEADDGLGEPCAKCGVREIMVDPQHVVEIDGKAVKFEGVEAITQ